MRRLFLASSALLAILLANPGFAAGAYHRAIMAAPKSLDPQQAVTASETAVLMDLYEGLVSRDATGKLAPGVASDWSFSADGLTVTFHLRPSRWSNGEPVTAEDFVLTFRRLMDKANASPLADRLSIIKNAARIRAGKAQPEEVGVRAVDESTLEIRLEAPAPTLAELLAGPAGLPLFLRQPTASAEPPAPPAPAASPATPPAPTLAATTPAPPPSAATSDQPAADPPPDKGAEASADKPADATAEASADKPAEGSGEASAASENAAAAPQAETTAANAVPAPANPEPAAVAPAPPKAPPLFGPVVNGAYRLVAESATELQMVRNEAFRDASSVAIEELSYDVLPKPEAALDAFDKGTVQSTDQAPVYGLPALKARLGASLHVAPFNGTYYLSVETARRPLSDARVRRALAIAIDRKQIADTIWGGAMLPALSFVPHGLPDYAQPAAIDAPATTDERRAAAKALLKEAGFDPKTRIELRMPKSDLNRRTAQAIIADWAAIGVTGVLVETDPANHYKLLQAGKSGGIANAVWIGDDADPGNYLGLLTGDDETGNFPHFANADFDKAIKQAAVTVDPAMRQPLIEKADAIVARDVPVIPLLQYASLALVSPTLKGWSDNALNLHLTRYLTLE